MQFYGISGRDPTNVVEPVLDGTLAGPKKSQPCLSRRPTRAPDLRASGKFLGLEPAEALFSKIESDPPVTFERTAFCNQYRLAKSFRGSYEAEAG